MPGLPAVVRESPDWSDNAVVCCGPFQMTAAATPYMGVVVPNFAAGTVDMWRSTDAGQTWAVADAAGAPTTLATAVGERTVTAYFDTVVSVVTVGFGDSSGTFTVREFNLSTGLWVTTASHTTTAPWAANRTGKHAAWLGNGNGILLIYFQAAPELVSGTLYRRINLKRWQTSNSATFTNDVISGTTTAAGTQVHYDARYGQGTGSMFCLWTQSDDLALHCRRQTATSTWGAATTLGGAVTDPTVDYPVGVGQYAQTASMVNLVYADVAAGQLRAAQAASNGGDTDGAWTNTLVEAAAPDTTDAPAAVAGAYSAGAYVFRPRSDGTRALDYVRDRGVGMAVGTSWNAPMPWRRGSVSALHLSMWTGAAGGVNRILVAYVRDPRDGGPTQLVVDALWVFLPKQSRAAGTYQTIIDTRVDAYDTEHPFTLVLDADAAAGVTASGSLYTGDNATDPAVPTGAALGAAGEDTYGEAVAGDTQRYLKGVLVLSGTATVGLTGY